MKGYSEALLVTVFAVSVIGCEKKNAGSASVNVDSADRIRADERESLVGRYGLLSGGSLVPCVRVVHPPSSREFVMQEWGTGDWQGSKTFGRPLNSEELTKLEAAGLPDSAIALSFGKTILVKVSKADAVKLSGSTGFALLSDIGPIELTPM